MAGPQSLLSYHFSRGRKPCGRHTRLPINIMTCSMSAEVPYAIGRFID